METDRRNAHKPCPSLRTWPLSAGSWPSRRIPRTARDRHRTPIFPLIVCCSAHQRVDQLTSNPSLGHKAGGGEQRRYRHRARIFRAAFIRCNLRHHVCCRQWLESPVAGHRNDPGRASSRDHFTRGQSGPPLDDDHHCFSGARFQRRHRSREKNGGMGDREGPGAGDGESDGSACMPA